MAKTSIELPDELIKELRKFNKKHPERPISISGVCRPAVEKALKAALKKEK